MSAPFSSFSFSLQCTLTLSSAMLASTVTHSSSSSRSRSRVAGPYVEEVQSVAQRLMAYSDEKKSHAFNNVNVSVPCAELTKFTAADDEGFDCADKGGGVWSVALVDRA